MIAALGGVWLTADMLLDSLQGAYDIPDASLPALLARLDELIEAGLVEAA